MSRIHRIRQILTRELDPWHLELIDETIHHKVPPEGESHLKLLLVSERFKALKPLARHRLVNGLLAQEFATGLHALALHTWTAEEWFAKGGQELTSPPCLGGGKDAGVD